LLSVTFTSGYNNSLAGFPDGHFTDYEKAVSRPFGWLCWGSTLFSLYFVCLGVPTTSLPGLRLRTAVFAYIAVIILPAVCVRWYYLYYLQLDSGYGG
jgi:hypothetical protein